MECWILVVKNKIRAFILGALILSFLNEINASDLEEYKSQAKNASVIVYGKSQDGETYVLLAHDRRGFWTPPGGKREANQSILDTAAAELYEETAAFDLFNPSRIKPLLKKQPLKSVFKYNGHTDLFALNIGDQIDQCKNISHNYKERVKGKKHSFDEMNNWKLCKANDLFNSLKAHPHTVNQDTILNKIGKLPKYVFNSLWSFYNNGSLENLMKTSTILLSQKQQKQKEQEIDAFLSSPERQAILRKNQKELFKHQPEDFFGKQPKKQQTQIKAPVAQKAKTSAQKKADDATRQLAVQQKKADDAARQLAAQKKKADDAVRQSHLVAQQKKADDAVRQLAAQKKKADDAVRQLAAQKKKADDAARQLAAQKKKAQAVAAQRAAAQKARTLKAAALKKAQAAAAQRAAAQKARTLKAAALKKAQAAAAQRAAAQKARTLKAAALKKAQAVAAQRVAAQKARTLKAAALKKAQAVAAQRAATQKARTLKVAALKKAQAAAAQRKAKALKKA